MCGFCPNETVGKLSNRMKVQLYWERGEHKRDRVKDGSTTQMRAVNYGGFKTESAMKKKKMANTTLFSF